MLALEMPEQPFGIGVLAKAIGWCLTSCLPGDTSRKLSYGALGGIRLSLENSRAYCSAQWFKCFSED